MQQGSKNNNRLRIAVSACLLGESVRYDGRDKRHPFVAGALASQCELISICPEVGIGLGVPRSAIELRRIGKLIQARGVIDRERDFTAELQAYAQQQAQLWPDIDGYIFKSRSPSCGLTDVPVLPQGLGAGVYAAEWMRCCPVVPVVDEMELQTEAGQQQFLDRAVAYRQWREGGGGGGI